MTKKVGGGGAGGGRVKLGSGLLRGKLGGNGGKGLSRKECRVGNREGGGEGGEGNAEC